MFPLTLSLLCLLLLVRLGVYTVNLCAFYFYNNRCGGSKAPVPSVLDLRIAHERFGSTSDPSINGRLHYPNDLDGPLNEAAADKIRQYRADYNNRPSNAISFMPAIASTSGRLHSEFVRLLSLQETVRFFAASGVQLAQHNCGQFHYRRAAFSSQLKSKVGNILAKAAALRITLDIHGAPIASRSHTHPSHE
jgi:hypothetical protein